MTTTSTASTLVINRIVCIVVEPWHNQGLLLLPLRTYVSNK